MGNIINDMTAEKLASYFDHTQLKAYASEADFKILCREAARYHFKMVAINPAPVALCKKLLKGTGVHVGAAISFPLGQETLKTKLQSTKDAIENGCDEIDYVINIGKVKERDYGYIKSEMEAIVAVCREHDVISKVIFENCYLEKEEIKKLALIAGEVGPDFIKTSTGFGTGGARPEDVRLMKETAGDRVKVKAAGGIRSLKDAYEMIEAGAERLGSTASVKIMEEFAAR